MDGTTLAERLKQLRLDLGIGLRALGRQAGIAHSMLSRYESGQRTPSFDQLVKILDALGVEDPEREQMLALVRPPGPGRVVAGVPGRHLAQLVGYERTAVRITDVSPMMIPGLLQTRGYARAVFGEGPDIDRRVRRRMERAEIITRPDDPIEFRAILHMVALTDPIAPPDMMRDQLRHLLEIGELPNVTIQLVPDPVPGWLPSHVGPFILFEFAEASPLVYLEHYRTSTALWDPEDVRSFIAAADEIAQKAMTPTRTAEVIAKMVKEPT